MTQRKRDPAKELAEALAIHAAWQAEPTRVAKDELLGQHPTHAHLLEALFTDDEEEEAEIQDSRTLGDYRLVREIGRGGMGKVYLARDECLGNTVAVKVLPASVLRSERAVARFKREAQLAAQLDHPGIVRVLNIGHQDEVHYFAMEYVAGAPLKAIVSGAKDTGLETASGETIGDAIANSDSPEAVDRDRPDTDWSRSYIETVVDLTAQVAEALDYAHQHGVIHRDVKPANILVTRDGRALLADFGIAWREDLPALTMTGDFAGTPYYISPEQAMAKRATVDHRTDVFSLGVTLYELVTLGRPFEGETNREVLDKIIGKEPIDPCKLNERLSPDLGAIVLKAIEKDVDRRYSTASEMAEDLRAFLDYRPIQARRATWPHQLSRWIRREPWKAALAGTLASAAILVIALTAYFVRELMAANQRALTQQAKADDLLRRYQLLENVVDLRQVIELQESCYPAWPDQIEKLRDWRDKRAVPLVAKLPQLRAMLQELHGRAEDYTEADRQRDMSTHPRAHEQEVALNMKRRLEENIEWAKEHDDQGKLEVLESTLTDVLTRLEDIEAEISKQRTWRFSDKGPRVLARPHGRTRRGPRPVRRKRRRRHGRRGTPPAMGHLDRRTQHHEAPRALGSDGRGRAGQ